MHFLERYALTCGVKIKKPFIYEKFFPLAVEKYITIHPASKYDSKSYDYWQDVVDILAPILTRAGIAMVQIGTANDPNLKGCYRTSGQTNIGQVAYILNNAMLHLGVDSFPTHIASSYDKKIVCMYSNTFAEIVKPYWGNPSDHILLEPTRPNNEKPSFSAQEVPKTINRIVPERIAKAVCEQLGLEYDFPYTSVAFGARYSNLKLIELVPNQLVDVRKMGLDGIVVRMDYLFNEAILAKQLSVCACSIVTNKVIDVNLLRQFKQNIREFVYILDENHSPDFVASLREIGLNYALTTEMSEEELQKLKIYYMEFGAIYRKSFSKPDFKGIPSEKLYYKSNKITLSDGKIFPSKAAWLNDKPVTSFDFHICPIVDCPEFWQEGESFYLLTKG